MSDLSDEAIMAGVKEGQTEKLGLLVARYERPLFSFALRVVGDRATADDAFQETFLKVLSKRTSYKVGSPFRPWLYQICLNTCRDSLRRRKRRPTVEMGEGPSLADPALGPEELTAQAAVAQRVREAIGELPNKHREIFILHYYQSLPYLEIAQIVGIPVGTVKSRMFHATQKLSAALQDLR